MRHHIKHGQTSSLGQSTTTGMGTLWTSFCSRELLKVACNVPEESELEPPRRRTSAGLLNSGSLIESSSRFSKRAGIAMRSSSVNCRRERTHAESDKRTQSSGWRDNPNDMHSRSQKQICISAHEKPSTCHHLSALPLRLLQQHFCPWSTIPSLDGATLPEQCNT